MTTPDRPTTVQGFLEDYLAKVTEANPPDPAMRAFLELVFLAGVNAAAILITQRTTTVLDLSQALTGITVELETARVMLVRQALDDRAAMGGSNVEA